MMAPKPPTIAQRIAENAARINRWYAANPQFEEYEGATDAPKIFIEKEVLFSPAYRSLSRVAMLLYQDFLEKREMRHSGSIRSVDGSKKKRWSCANNGEIQYPYSIASANGFSRAQFRNGIDELQAKGFLDITHMGVGGRKPKDGEGDSTKYFLDHRWRNFDIETQRAVKPPRNPRTPDRRSDRGFQQYWSQVRMLATILYIDARCKQIVGIENDTGLTLNQYRNRYQ
jgi:hypothetical protein